MNIHNLNYIGATGLHPIDEIITENIIYTSNDLIEVIKNTSNNLIAYDVYNSNQLVNYVMYTSNEIILPDVYTDKIPATLYYDAPPLHQKLPCPKSNFFNNDFLTIENVSFADRFTEITSATNRNIHDYITKIIDILIEHEYNFSLNSVSATEWEKYNAVLSLNYIVIINF